MQHYCFKFSHTPSTGFWFFTKTTMLRNASRTAGEHGAGHRLHAKATAAFRLMMPVRAGLTHMCSAGWIVRMRR